MLDLEFTGSDVKFRVQRVEINFLRLTFSLDFHGGRWPTRPFSGSWVNVCFLCTWLEIFTLNVFSSIFFLLSPWFHEWNLLVTKVLRHSRLEHSSSRSEWGEGRRWWLTPCGCSFVVSSLGNHWSSRKSRCKETTAVHFRRNISMKKPTSHTFLKTKH